MCVWSCRFQKKGFPLGEEFYCFIKILHPDGLKSWNLIFESASSSSGVDAITVFHATSFRVISCHVKNKTVQIFLKFIIIISFLVSQKFLIIIAIINFLLSLFTLFHCSHQYHDLSKIQLYIYTLFNIYECLNVLFWHNV